MPQQLLPSVPYDRTANRPGWEDLPAEFRQALEERLGARVVDVRVSGCGFTPGFAALVNTADGEQHFIKAASRATDVAGWYEQEAKFTAVLPAGIPSARLRWSADLAGHFVLCLDPIPGAHTPELPWVPAELKSALEALTVTSEILAQPTAKLLSVELGSWGEVIDSALNKWRTGQAEHPQSGELARLESRFDEMTRDSTSLIHCDLRLDNIVIDSVGRAWICDWNWLVHGPVWFDLISLLLSAEASGLDVDALFESHPVATGLPPDALDAGLAAFLGYYLYAGAQPEIDTSPEVRNHQRYYGELTLRWLARRQGWV